MSSPAERKRLISLSKYELADEIERLRNALERISMPLFYLKEDANRDGVRLDGRMAIALAEDHTHLNRIAHSALNDGGSYYAPPSSVNGGSNGV